MSGAHVIAERFLCSSIEIIILVTLVIWDIITFSLSVSDPISLKLYTDSTAAWVSQFSIDHAQSCQWSLIIRVIMFLIVLC
jgi:hypothetical protein